MCAHLHRRLLVWPAGGLCVRTLIVEDVALCCHAEAMTYLRGEVSVREYEL